MMGCRIRHGACRSGFTLVEVLVVVGIIALLIALLLPALAAIRARSRVVTCMTQQRSIMHAALQRAQENGGFLPLAGKVTIPAGTQGIGSLPLALNDSRRERYAYSDSRSFSIPTVEVAASPKVALMSHLDVEDYDGFWVCPEAIAGVTFAARPVTSLVIGTNEYVMFDGIDDRNSYAINAGPSGFHHSQDKRARHRGNLVRVRGASQTMWIADAANAGQGVELSVFSPASDASAAVSLAEARDRTSTVDLTAGFDRERHSGVMNVTFLDGHSERHEIDSGNLERIYLWLP